MKRVGYIKDADEAFVDYKCPGCGLRHILRIGGDERPRWGFNGSLERPTISPSINSWREFGGGREKQVCHHFVRNGRIQFLNDCTHDLKGQTVDLPEYEPVGGADE